MCHKSLLGAPSWPEGSQVSFPPRSVTAAAHVGGGPVLPNDEKVTLVVFANPPPPRGSASVVEGWPQTGPERSWRRP